MIDLSNWDFAEDIYFFVHQQDEYVLFCQTQRDIGPLSMAEYVEKFRKIEFTKWLLDISNLHLPSGGSAPALESEPEEHFKEREVSK